MKKLDEEDWTFLSTDECIKIINSFEDNKSPGIHGLGKSFYSRFWLILGKDLVEVLNNKGNNKITELRTILQRESQNS